MSKTATATAAVTGPAVQAAIDVRPDYITITEFSHIAWPAAIALIRQGWTVHPDYLPVEFKSTGHSTIMLTRAKQDTEFNTLAVAIAEKAEADAAASHKLAYERDVAIAAQSIVDAEKKAAKAAELAAEIAAQRAALQALEQAAKATA